MLHNGFVSCKAKLLTLSELRFTNPKLTMWQMKIVIHGAHLLTLMLMFLFSIEQVYCVYTESDIAFHSSEITEIRQLLRQNEYPIIIYCAFLDTAAV